MSFNKSMLSGNKIVTKKLINSNSSISNKDELRLNSTTVDTLSNIHNNYIIKMANRDYTNIPHDLFEYLSLTDVLLSSLNQQINPNIKLFLQIALDSLTGALNSKSLNSQNADLEINLAMTTKKLNDVLSGKNEVKTLQGNTSGQFSIEKTFKLAPLYSYYIYLFGMPEFGVGFDKKKLLLVQSILAKHKII